MRKQTLLRFIFMAALLALTVPVAASAQGWPDYRNDDDYRRNRDYDRDYRRNRDYDRNGRYDDRYLRDSIRRLDQLAGDFQRDLDRTLDRSRENGTRHEDHLNADTREFRRAVSDLRNSFGNGRDFYRSEGEARRVLDTAAHVEDEVEHHFNDQRLYSQWRAIERELSVISDAYHYRGADNGEDDSYRRDRRRNTDDYRRDRGIDWGRIIRNWPN